MNSIAHLWKKYPKALCIQQYGSKQLFKVTQDCVLPTLVFSYDTIIACILPDSACMFITRHKYSPTTSKHCTFVANDYPHEYVDQERLEQMI